MAKKMEALGMIETRGLVGLIDGSGGQLACTGGAGAGAAGIRQVDALLFIEFVGEVAN